MAKGIRLDVDLSDFWEDSDYARKTYVDVPITDELVASVETELGLKLPEAYIELMRSQNGGIPKRDCFRTQVPTSWAEDHVALNAILGIGRNKTYSLCGECGAAFWRGEWGYPDFALAICDCPSAGHDMIMLDYRRGPTEEPPVIHVDQEMNYKVTRLAGSFGEFVNGLVPSSNFDLEDDGGKPPKVISAWIDPELREQRDESED